VTPAAAPPGSLRVVFLLARVALRRWLNRAASGFRRKKQAPDAPRTGTPRKGGAGLLGLALIGLLFIGYGFSLSYTFLHQLGGNLARGAAQTEGQREAIPWTAPELRDAALRTIGVFLFLLAASQV